MDPANEQKKLVLKNFVVKKKIGKKLMEKNNT